MRKQRKFGLRAFGIGLFVAAVSITPLIIPREAEAQNSSYYNWDQLSALDEQYAYAKIYRTADTVITPKVADLTRPTEDEDEGANDAYDYVVNTTNGQVVILLEDTTAVDANGNKVDVIFRLNHFRPWSSVTSDDHEARILFRNKICGTDIDVTTDNMATLCTGRNSARQADLGVDSPIMFWIETVASDVDFSVEYIVKGSYNNTTTKGTPVPSIDRLSFATLDYDVKRWSSGTPDELFAGDEGISYYNGLNPESTKTTFYYQKNNQNPDFNLREGNNGIAIDTNNVGNEFNGIYYANSAIGIVTGIQNSTYSFRYSARKAGITVFFGSPIKYGTPAPKKYIVASNKTICDQDDCSSNTVKTGDSFNYVISQDVPDQYSSDVDILTFMSLWSKYPNIPRDHFYTSFVIKDTINSNLIPATVSSIKIYNRANEDVTNMFTIALSGNNVQATAKADALTSKAFYAETFRIVVPVTVKSTVSSSMAKNTATTTYQQTGDSDPTVKDSNEVNTTIKHTVTVNHYSTATGEKLAATTITSYAHGSQYRTSALTALPAGYRISDTLPANASGTVLKDEVVNYYYNLYHTVTTRHISKETGEEIAETVTKEYIHNDEYETKIAEDLPDGYVLVETPENAVGTADDDIEVIYIYDLAPAPKTFDAGIAPFAFAFTGIGAFMAGAIIFLTRRR
ncbi:MucBP domain-containing protein [Candidatus Saccharibacteria bacterium]|nr:MucBP domain-containing protein [Candidatus Saccharibacteria bacterium]